MNLMKLEIWFYFFVCVFLAIHHTPPLTKSLVRLSYLILLQI